MSLWRSLLGFRHHRASRLEPLTSDHAGDLARLHARGGFARGWAVAECEALLADRSVVADAAFHDQAFAGRDGKVAHAAVLSRRAGDEAEILVIVVDPGFRRSGLGARLLAVHCEGLARLGVRHLFLEVAEDNAPARALYARFGFVEAGTRPGYYPKPDGGRANALVLRRDFA